MPIIEWSDKYMSLEIEPLDRGRKYIVAVVNSLSDALEEGKEETEVNVSLESLSNFFKEYRKEEEVFLLKTSYPEKKHHIDEHTAFYAKLKELQKKYEGAPDNAHLYETYVLFKDYFMNHCMGTDMGCADYYEKEQLKQDVGI